MSQVLLNLAALLRMKKAWRMQKLLRRGRQSGEGQASILLEMETVSVVLTTTFENEDLNS